MTVSDNVGDVALAQRLAANTIFGDLDYRSILLDGLKLAEGLDVLDVACGNGAFTLDFKRAVGSGRATGVDSSAELVEAARRSCDEVKLEVSFLICDAAELPFANASFDRICCSYAVYHFPEIDIALDEMFRVLRPGGRLVLTGPTMTNNLELYELHRLGGGTISRAMGRDLFETAIGSYLKRSQATTEFVEYQNNILFPSKAALLDNYAATKLFLDNVQEAERPGFLARLGQMDWPPVLQPLTVTKTIGVFLVSA